MDKVMNERVIPLSKRIFLWISFFIIIGSACFQFQDNMPFLSALFGFLSKVIFLLTFVVYIINCISKNRQFINQFDIWIFIFSIWIITSSEHSGHSWISYVPLIMKTLTVRYLMALYVPGSTKQITHILASVFSSIVYLNFIQLLFFPSVMGGNYLITSNYNQFGAIFLPAIFIKLIDSFQTKKRKSLYFLIFVCLASVVIEGSATTSIALLILVMTLFFIKRSRLIRLEYMSICVCVVLFFITFTVPIISLLLDFPYIEQFVQILGKDITFSGRTTIWQLANLQIYRNPIFGYGICSLDDYKYLLSGAINSHNIILHILLQGGIIGLIIFTFFILNGMKQIQRISNNYYKQILILTSVLFLLMSQFEVYINTFIYIYVYLMYMSKDLLNDINRS